MHVSQFERAGLLCLDSLYQPLSMRKKKYIQGPFVDLKLMARSDLEFYPHFFSLYKI